MATTSDRLKSRLDKLEAKQGDFKTHWYKFDECADGFESTDAAIEAAGAIIGESDIVWKTVYEAHPDERPNPIRYRLREGI